MGKWVSWLARIVLQKADEVDKVVDDAREKGKERREKAKAKGEEE